MALSNDVEKAALNRQQCWWGKNQSVYLQLSLQTNFINKIIIKALNCIVE